MPIKIDTQLPAFKVLQKEAVPLITERDAIRQDIRPLQIALLNLMPEKATTETQIARLLGQSPIQIELTLIRPESHQSKTTHSDHLETFYRPWSAVRKQKFDGLVITGAPVEKIAFEEVFYWKELEGIFHWSSENVTECLDICWGAQAALWHFHQVPKHLRGAKLFGIYSQNVVVRDAPLLRGINDAFACPVSRYTEVRRDDLPSSLKVLVASPATGICMVEDAANHRTYFMNHLEYDSNTLATEYNRDREKGLPTALPANYFPNDDPNATVVNRWRSTAHLLFRNWIDRIYANTPFDWVFPTR